ncbi:MAG: nucleotidyltransferase family protein [Streptococcus sp.]
MRLENLAYVRQFCPKGGEPTIIDKWTRAQMAMGLIWWLNCPSWWRVSADYFAQGAVSILDKLGIQNLAFGTEELLDYQGLSDVIVKNLLR